MKRLISLAVLLTSTTLHANSNHQIEYGVINFDSFYASTNIDKTLSFLDYTYFFTEIKSDDSPIELAAKLQRINRFKTNITLDALGFLNASGQYYLANGYDIEYQVLYDSNIWGIDEDIGLNGGVIVNFPSLDNWQYGLGLQSNIFYRDSDRLYDNFDGKNWKTTTLAKFQATYTNLEKGKGWYIKTQLGYHWDSNTAHFESDINYFHSKYHSSALKVNYTVDKYDPIKRKLTSIGLAQKYWFSDSTAIDFGISFNTEQEDYPGSDKFYSDEDEYFFFDLNGTWRF